MKKDKKSIEMKGIFLNPIQGFKPSQLPGIARGITGKIWDESEKELFSFNKTLITLSSSALILSFTLISLTNLTVNKICLTISWALFLLTIILGSFLEFFRFLYRVTDRLIKSRADAGNYKKSGKPLSEIDEILFYFNIRSLMFGASFAELITFILAFVFLMIAAYLSI